MTAQSLGPPGFLNYSLGQGTRVEWGGAEVLTSEDSSLD